MKRILLILTLFSILTSATAQITTGTKISAMPTHVGNVDSAYVPIIINGINKKTQAYNVNKHRIDSLVAAVGAGISQWGQIGGTLSNQLDLQAALNAKQDLLISGTNIKTVNSTSLLGSGNVAVQSTLVSGTNIKTINGSSLLGSGDLTVNTFTDPTTTTGDIIYRNSSGLLTRLGIGSAGQILSVSGSIPAWISQATATWGGKFSSTSSLAGPFTLGTNPAVQYTGVGGHTLTLPSLSANQAQTIMIKNAGTGNVTIARAGSDVIYTTSSVTSFTLTPGQSIMLVAMSTTWQGYFISGGSGTDASAITTGTLADGRLSSNVPLLNAANSWSATNTFNSATITGSLGYTPVTNARNITIAGAGTQDLSADRTYYPKTYFQQAIEALGSEVKGQSIGLNMDQMSTTSFTAVSGTVYWTALWLPSPQTLTGIKYWLGTTGSFTGDAFNGFALYTYSGGTLTQVATSANDPAIWTGTGGTYISVPFTSTYSAGAGLYFVAFLFHSSATTTAPTFGIGASVATGGMQSGDFTNSAKLNATHTSQTALPSTRLMSAITVTTLRPWVGVY